MSKKLAKRILIALSLTIVCLFLLVFGTLAIFYNKAKLDFDKLTFSNSGIRIYASESLDDSNFYNMDRKVISINELHPYTINAFVDIEDKRFYSHNGYDLKRIVKSSLVNMKNHSKSQGASTITQQLVKNTLLSNEKTYSRKVNEIMLAIKVEKNFSKDEIVNMYLNSIYFGSNAYGIENASNIYFNKSAKDLTINESAILAGIIKSPRLYSPKYNKRNCKKRKNLVLKQMLDNNHITLEEYNLNKDLDVECTNMPMNYENTYFQQAIIEACQLLNISEKELIRNDYQIITFMDSDIQNDIQKVFSNNDYDADKLSIVSSNDGKVLAYLGISPYDLTEMKRNPASTLKPLAVYLPAIQSNICTTKTPILDDETSFGDYTPHNTNNEYLGWIDIEEALTKSKNIPTLKLLNMLGIDKSIEFLNSLGIKTVDDDRSLALGLGALTNGISPIDLLSAWTVFSNNGTTFKLHFVDKILDKNGRIIFKSKVEGKQVCDSESAYLVNEMLKNATKTGTAKLLSNFDFDIASKTGTNYVNGKTLDLWNIAYTTDKISLCWLGSSNNEGLQDLTSSYSATKLNKEILTQIFDYTPNDFAIPDGIVSAEIDLLELKHNHILKLASMYTPDRYKQTINIRDDFEIENSDSFYAKPNTNLDVKINNFGAEIMFDTTEIFDYCLFKSNVDAPIYSTTNCNQTITFVDDKIFAFDEITYTLKTTNKYTNQVFFDTFKICPKDYLKNNIKTNLYNTKTRWYV